MSDQEMFELINRPSQHWTNEELIAMMSFKATHIKAHMPSVVFLAVVRQLLKLGV